MFTGESIMSPSESKLHPSESLVYPSEFRLYPSFFGMLWRESVDITWERILHPWVCG